MRNVIVESHEVTLACAEIKKAGKVGFDVETTGLLGQGQIFSIQVALDEDLCYYFNFNGSPDIFGKEIDPHYILKRYAIRDIVNAINQCDTIFIHNALFECGMCAQEGYPITAPIHCTLAQERVIRNNHPRYALEAIAPLYSDKGKLGDVKAFISKNKCYEKTDEGRRPAYEKVPFDMMVEYGCHDARLEYIIGLKQEEILNADKKIFPVFQNEKTLTSTTARIRERRIGLNRFFIQRAIEHETHALAEAHGNFFQQSGDHFKDSAKALTRIFDSLCLPIPRTTTNKTGISFDKWALAKIDHPLAKTILAIREKETLINTFYKTWLKQAERYDGEGIIHLNQWGAETGRLSSSDPNIHNLPKEKKVEGPFSVRGCFRPRKNFCFVMMDFDQQEFRMALDYANHRKIIRGIVNDGLCPHQMTADSVGISRDAAKIVNFLIIYGGGTKALAQTLKITEYKASLILNAYKHRMSPIWDLKKAVEQRALSRGYIFNWFGRKCYLSRPQLSYKMLNYLIQGGGADIIKVAMNRSEGMLAKMKSRLLLSLHDELLFEIHKDELDIVPKLRTMMQSIYPPRNGLALTVGVDHSWESWATNKKIAGVPS